MKPKIEYNLDLLNKFAQSVSKNYRVRVGILGNKDKRTEEGASNASIGLVHEMGSFTKNIPRRSFLVMPLQVKSKQILQAIGSSALKLLHQGNYRQIFVNLGIKCEEMIQEAFATAGWGAWPPNKPSTIAAKTPKHVREHVKREGRKLAGMPLVDTSQLRRSITSKVKEVH